MTPDILADLRTAEPEQYEGYILGPSAGHPDWQIEDDFELWHWVRNVINVQIPREKVCDDHVAPFKAFADAYFCRDNYMIWKASRGFGGKSAMLATLVLTEAISLGASITILGGSGEQSHRVREYLKGEHDNFPDHFWESPALKSLQGELWESAPTRGRTSLTNNGRTKALMASQTSVRGPHPQRLRGDEIDEMKQAIWDAAKGQPMESRGIEEQIVGSSTHQNPDGTMTHEIDMARKKGLPVHQWCYRETQTTNKGGWLTPEQVERKKQQVPIKVWEHEYELQEPSPENRALDQDTIENVFDSQLGNIQGGLGVKHVFEEPIEITEDMDEDEEPQYAVGADWGKNMDKTIIVVMRCDVSPIRVVAFYHMARQPWPMMIGRYEDAVTKYNDAAAAHDATGLGDVIHDHLTIMADGVKMKGQARQNLLSEYIMALEDGEIEIPHIEYMYREHKTMTSDDIMGGGHPPDSFVAGALAYRAAIYGWQELMF